MSNGKVYEKELMRIDTEIVELILKRIEVLKQFDYNRLKYVLTSRRKDTVESLAEKYGISRDMLLHIFSYIDGIAIESIKPLTVGFLGPRGSFTEEATLKMFNDQGALLTAYPSIYDIFRAVENREVEYGVVPLENSLEGSVGETLDMLAQSSVKICGETEVRISHNFIVKPGTRLEDIKIVLSHPMALAQCRNFIYTKLKNVKIETRSSTAEAVKECVERENVAAIGSELAARIYGGEILVRGIEDHKENYTRFIAIGNKPLDKGVDVKTSVIFTLRDVPGALYKALEPFAIRGINLTKIESRPIKNRPWEYMFFMDFNGSIEDSKIRDALEEFIARTTSVKILGSYKKIP
ncbi:MAG: prephenate dehydratase [Ignisphaera sp.]